MKLTEFVKQYSKNQVIDSSTFSLLGEDPQNIRCQVQYWRRQGHIILLKRGVYVLSNDLRKQPLSMGFVSNFLFSPSYISLSYISSEITARSFSIANSAIDFRSSFSKTEPVGLLGEQSQMSFTFSCRLFFDILCQK